MSTQSWSDGYITEIEYEHFFFGELAPAHMDYVCLQMGHRPPAVGQPFTYCELGCGMGLSSTVLAASNPQGRFYAADINPSHVITARRVVEEAGLDNVTHLEASFEEMLEIDLPQFDYIVFHGVWTWVSPRARRDIRRFVRARLKTGGAVYVSYNTAIGWERRHTLGRVFKELVGASHGPLSQRIEIAIGIMRGLVEQGEGYFAENEVAKGWVESVAKSSHRYLAHEYLNEHWDLFYHPDVAAEMAKAKLNYVGSTDVLRNFDRYVLKENSAKAADSLGNPALTELLKDLDTNWGLRRDVYMRGSAQWPQQEAFELFSKLEIALIQSRGKIENECKTPIGESTIEPKLLDPIADALAEGPCSLGKLQAAVPDYGFFDVLVVCSILTQNGLVEPAPMRECTDGGEGARRLNRVLAQRTLRGESFGVLAAPVIGSAVTTGDLESCCYHRIVSDGVEDPAELARLVTEDLAKIERKPTFEGEEADEDRFVQFCTDLFAEKVPAWRRLGAL